MNLRAVTDRHEWDSFVSTHSWGHPLQLWGWGEAKRSTGWVPHRLVLERDGKILGGAQVLLWPIPRLGRFIAYAPRGPVVDPADAAELLTRLAEWATSQSALYLRIEPAWRGKGLTIPKWRRAKHHIQMAETYLIDLSKTEDELMAAIDGKYRYYIRRSERDGVTIRRLKTSETGDVLAIYRETAHRAGFGLHEDSYYQGLSEALGDSSHLLVAEIAGRQVAFLWLATAGRTAYELYGGVSQEGRDARVNYLLKWQAIVMMKAAGYEIYDFNGRVSEGVSTFKENFAPEAVDYIGTWDRPLDQALYVLWEGLWPVIKRAGRLTARIRGK